MFFPRNLHFYISLFCLANLDIFNVMHSPQKILINCNLQMLIEQLKQLQYRIVEYAECSEEKEQSYNTLPFFNQDPYPNDLAQLRREKDILATKFLMPPVSISGQVGKLDESNLRNYMVSFV